jgi:hypothetical protein
VHIVLAPPFPDGPTIRRRCKFILLWSSCPDLEAHKSRNDGSSPLPIITKPGPHCPDLPGVVDWEILGSSREAKRRFGRLLSLLHSGACIVRCFDKAGDLWLVGLPSSSGRVATINLVSVHLCSLDVIISCDDGMASVRDYC